METEHRLACLLRLYLVTNPFHMIPRRYFLSNAPRGWITEQGDKGTGIVKAGFSFLSECLR